MAQVSDSLRNVEISPPTQSKLNDARTGGEREIYFDTLSENYERTWHHALKFWVRDLK